MEALLTWMVILKLGHIVDIAIDNNVQVSRLVMRRNVALGKYLGHLGTLFQVLMMFDVRKCEIPKVNLTRKGAKKV